jgi:calcium-dependent protein kinase
MGGNGKVYVAKDHKFHDRLVAIKKIPKPNEPEADIFRAEVDIMKALDHPSICRLFETYIDSAYIFLVMEFLDGGDLFDRFVEHADVFAECTVADIIKQVTGAMKYAHIRGFAHRDLKPENICFCSRDQQNTQLKVIDWGYGKYFGHQKMKSNVGTTVYVAPEVLTFSGASGGYTSACDLWSLGVLCYVALSGKTPFWGSTQEQLTRMKHEQYPIEGGVWDTISAEAKDFIRRLLRFCPRARSATDCLLQHPWLVERRQVVPQNLLVPIMTNLEHFSHKPDFLSLCMASVARQVDHSSLADIRDVFCMLDWNGEGTLDRRKVEEGFRRAFGHVPEDMSSIFAHLDLDGTERVTYTEFCAAALGDHAFEEESVLWAAFKAFDHSDTGWVSLNDLQAVLTSADVNQVWSREVCQNVAAEVIEYYGDWDNTIYFHDWLHLMQECCSTRCHRWERGRLRPRSDVGKSGSKNSLGYRHNSESAAASPKSKSSCRHRRSATLCGSADVVSVAAPTLQVTE